MSPALILPLIVALVGGIVYVAFDDKAAEIGRAPLWIGLLFLVAALAGSITIGG